MVAPTPLPPALEALLEQGRLAEARGQVQVARDLYERALDSMASDAPAWGVGRLLLGLGRTHLASRDAEAALARVAAILALPGEPEMAAIAADAVELRGRIHWHEGDLAAAAADFVELRARARQLGDAARSALGATWLADLALLEGATAQAIALHEEARADLHAAGDSRGEAAALARLATLYAELKRWNAAEQAFAEAATAATQLHDERLLATIELARAGMALDRENVERAHASADRAIDLARKLDDASLVARALVLNGAVARELGDRDRAARLLEQGERLAEDAGDLLLVAEAAREHADLLARDDRHAEALQALNRAYRAATQLRARDVDGETTRRLRRFDDGFLNVIRRWAQRIEGKDHATAGHLDRVADLTCEIARRMGADRQSLVWYRVGAFLHDIGKLGIPAAILNKAGRLTPEEWTIVKRHPVAGAEMLRDVDFPWEVRPIVESHHECWDGSGYPHGLAGEEIPLAARIFTVADVYDALVSRRAFKSALGHDEAIDVMRRDVGRQFDPAVFRVFEEVVREGVAIPGVTSAAALPVRAESREPAIVDDELTSVADRSSWMQRAAHALARRRGADQSVAVLLLDIDHFERVNAAYGRLQGDDLLWAVAKVLQRGLRTGDLVGRRGSDEFLVLLPATPPDVALEVAHRLREACAQLRCARRDAPDQQIAISVSIAVVGAPQDGDSVEALLAAADRALHRAKRDGRDRVVVAEHGDAGAARARLAFDTFVGREEELRTMVGLLDLASRGDARLVSISGEEGIGKSALVRRLEPEIRLRAGTLVTAQCLEGDQASAYAPWADVLARLHATGLLAQNQWRALPQLVPGIPPSGDGDEWALTPSLLHEEIVRAVRRAARERLLVLVFEDVQWADTATWTVLDALLGALDGEQLFVVLTLRPDEARAAADWRRRLMQHPRAEQLALQRFTLDELRRWVQVVFHDADPGDEFPRVLHAYTEGIPLHVVHVLRALAESGGIWYGGTRWEWRPTSLEALPPGVAFILERRLQRLSPPARGILATAAVLGAPFAVELLVATANAPEAQVTAALDEGVAAGIVTPVAGRDGAFTFTHALLGEAITREVPERRRQRMHEVAARLLELRTPSSVDEIAGHYHAAGLDAEAYRYAVAAADRMGAAFAHDLALDALQVAQRYAPSARDLATLRVRLATVAVGAGRYAPAEAWCDLALEWIEGSGDAHAALEVRRLRECVRMHSGKPPLRTLEELRAILAAAPEGDVALRADVQLTASAVATAVADWPLAATLARKALETLGDRATLAHRGAAGRLLALARDGAAPDEAISLAHDAVAHATASGDRLAMARARLALGELQLRRGRVGEAEEALGDALEAARSAHAAPLAAGVSRALGELRSRQGTFGEAAQWLGDAERIFTAIGDVPESLRTTFVAANVARDMGERSRAHALYNAATSRARTLEVAWLELASLAGAALTNGGPESPSSWKRWERATELMTSAVPEWWFPGREMVDALALQMALASGHTGAAFDLFSRARHRLDAVDPYAGAWLVAECAGVLERAGLPAIDATRRFAAERARTLAFVPLAERLEEPAST